MVLPMSTATPKETPRTWSRLPRLAGRGTGGMPVGFAVGSGLRVTTRSNRTNPALSPERQ